MSDSRQPSPSGEIDAVALLRKTPPFEGLADEELGQVAALVRERRYRRGMIIFLEGEPVEAVYLLKSGAVKASTTGPDGQEQIVSVLGPGDIFPHVGFLDGGPAPGTTQALEDSVVGLIRREEFFRLLRQRPELAIRLVGLQGEQIRRLHLQLRDIALRNVPARLASILLRLAEQHGVVTPEGIRIGVSLSQQELASLAGTSRESVSRALSEFRREGSIAIEEGHTIIKDPERLKMWT